MFYCCRVRRREKHDGRETTWFTHDDDDRTTRYIYGVYDNNNLGTDRGGGERVCDCVCVRAFGGNSSLTAAAASAVFY